MLAYLAVLSVSRFIYNLLVFEGQNLDGAPYLPLTIVSYLRFFQLDSDF